MVLILIFIGKLFYNFYAKYFPNVALLLLILTLLRLFRKDVRAFLQGVRLVYLDKKELIMSRRARAYIVGAAVLLFLLLALPMGTVAASRTENRTPALGRGGAVEKPDDGTIVNVPCP